MKSKTLSDKRKELFEDLNELHKRNLNRRYISYGIFKRILDKMNNQDKQCFKEILEEIEEYFMKDDMPNRNEDIRQIIRQKIGEELLK